MSADEFASSSFILKIAGACNLNCTYCYVYNLGDTSWQARPRVMSEGMAVRSLERIRSYALQNDVHRIVLSLHGGEPLLVGRAWMRWLLERIAEMRSGAGLEVVVSLQTNGTLLDDDWLELLIANGVRIGVSIDGPEEWHDQFRVTHSGRGSYTRVRRAIDLLVAAGPRIPAWGVLTVANPELPAVEAYRHLVDIGVTRMDFLWPDHHHDARPPWPPGSLSQYFLALFDEWWGQRNPAIGIRWFEAVIGLLMGGPPLIDSIGPQPISEVVIETDGALQPLDVLRICGDHFTATSLDVVANSIDQLRTTPLFRAGLENQERLAHKCTVCPLLRSCGGGYFPHRWSSINAFSNPSVHCEDLIAVIGHIEDALARELVA